VTAALFGGQARSLDAVFDGLADHLDHHCAPGLLAQLVR
jgi:adenosylcobyric acid synthase